MYGNKRFFKCPNMHGVIVPIEQVHILVPQDVSQSSNNVNVHAHIWQHN